MTNRSTTAPALAVSLPWQDRSIAGSEAEVSEAVSAAEASGEAVSEAEEPVASSDRHTDFESNTYLYIRKTMKTKKWMTAAIAMVCMVLLNSCSYNKMVEKDEAVSTAWSNVETQYQRRADLIPNLVSP